MLKKLLAKFAAFKVKARDWLNQKTPAALKGLSREEQGKLENRFHYARPMGGFRLAPSGKHYRGWATYHGKPGSKRGGI
jgi:hypothetical protein